MDTFGSGKSSPFERVDGWVWFDASLPCFLPARFRRMRVSLRNQNKCKPSIASYLSNYINSTQVQGKESREEEQ